MVSGKQINSNYPEVFLKDLHFFGQGSGNANFILNPPNIYFITTGGLFISEVTVVELEPQPVLGMRRKGAYREIAVLLPKVF